MAARYRVGLLLLFGCLFMLAGDALSASCGPPPPAKPQRRTGGESVPPLPLPATPLRRSERKREPSPPALVGKIEYGELKWGTDERGQRYSYRDWTTDPADSTNLVNWVNQRLSVRYRSVQVDLGKFSYDPAEVPVLYMSGHEAFSFSDEVRRKLRWFIQDGGYILGDACCGQKPFMESFMTEMKAICPQRTFEPLPADHPVYRCFYPIEDVEYIKDGKSLGRKAPYLLAINIGCRAAVIFTPYDCSCGWDNHTHDAGERIAIADAKKLGVNIVAYFLANYHLGRFLSTEKIYHQEGEPSRDRLVFGQIVHGGDWDPHPSGDASLLKFLAGNTTMPVQFKREAIDLAKAETLRHPFLYMTGHKDLKFSDAEVQGLRNYIRAGGMLFADSCCGRAAFDAAFRRELTRALPEFKLEPIPLNDPFFTSAMVDVREVTYSPQMLSIDPERKAPELEGVRVGGRWVVIYSKYGIGTHWDNQPRPYALAYEPADSLKLALDVVTYAMTH